MSKTSEKTLKSQIWALKMFYMIICALFKEVQSTEICNFWLKSATKSNFIFPESIVSLQYIFLQWKFATLCNMRSRDDQKLTCAQIHGHPFTKFVLQTNLLRIVMVYIFRTPMNSTFLWAMPNKSISVLPIT